MKMTLTVIVKGTTCDNEPFVANVQFTMIPPKDGEAHYGTGYYMAVEESSDVSPKHKEYVDVRYERTTDIEILADKWIKNWYGKNAKEVIKK